MKKWLIVMTTTLSSLSLYAQDTVQISLDELRQRVVMDNMQAQIADKEAEMARADYRQSNALFLPKVKASHTAMYTTNPLMAFGSKLNQEILTPQDFDPALLNDPDGIGNFATEIQVLQPLLNIDGVQERKAARIQTEARELQSERTREYLELEVAKAYMQLQLAYEGVTVLEKAQKMAQEGVQLSRDYYNEGLLQKTDVLEMQVRTNEVENQLNFARSNVRNASDYLGVLIAEELENQVYKPAERAPRNTQLATFDPTLSSARKDLAAMEKAVAGYEKMVDARKFSFVPRINAFGSFQLYDDQLLGFDASGYLVGVQLSWDIFNGYQNVGKISRARAQYEKAKLESDQYKMQSQLELNQANRKLQDAQNKVELTRLALEQSKEAYRIRKDRFKEGLEKTTDLLQAETRMFQKELEYRKAIFQYNFTKEYLKFLTK